MPRKKAGQGLITVIDTLSRPNMSRRIYARRAALTGLMIAATCFFIILQIRFGISMAMPIISLTLAFAAMFSATVAEATTQQFNLKMPTKGAGYWLIFAILLVGSLILAPLALVFSTVQFFRSAT